MPAQTTIARRLTLPIRRACFAAFALGTVLNVTGCAGTQWERTVYQGASSTSKQCLLIRKPADAPCSELGDFESYERERNRAKNESPPAQRVYPIDEHFEPSKS